MFLVINGITDLKYNQKETQINTPKDFPTETSIYHIDENLVVYELIATSNYTGENIVDFSMSTNYTECLTQKICNELFNRFLKINPNRKIESNIVEECYENLEIQNYYIFKTDRILVRFEERNPDFIDDRILEFIEFYNNNSHFEN